MGEGMRREAAVCEIARSGCPFHWGASLNSEAESASGTWQIFEYTCGCRARVPVYVVEPDNAFRQERTDYELQYSLSLRDTSPLTDAPTDPLLLACRQMD